MSEEKVTLRVHKVKCSRCGEAKFVNPQALEKRLAKYGSVEEIEKKWVCRKCLDAAEKIENEALEGDKPKKEKKVKEEVKVEEPKTPEETAKATIDAVAGEEPKYIDEEEGKFYAK